MATFGQGNQTDSPNVREFQFYSGVHNAFNAWEWIRTHGYEIIPTMMDGEFNNGSSLPIALEKGFMVDDVWLGGLHQGLRLIKKLGKELPYVDSYPRQLFGHMHRTCGVATMGAVVAEFLKSHRPFFVKPVAPYKLFTGCTVKSVQDLDKVFHVDEGVEVWVSDVVEWEVEWRVFVHRGVIIDARPYRGDFTCYLHWPTVWNMRDIFEETGSAPCSYSIDVGVIHGGNPTTKTALIEINDGWALGSYDIRSMDYWHMIADRWWQIVGNEDKRLRLREWWQAHRRAA